MARKINKLRVAEAGLFGTYQRLLDLKKRTDRTPTQLAAEQVEAQEHAAELEDKIRALGDDPNQVRQAVDSRAAERLRRYSNPDQPPTPS